jgi:glyoxylase-like metal-dependent hydrolase (beta-lactamase superfamily II)
MQILPNIFLLDGFAYAQHANFYLVHSEQGNIVIDAGTHAADLERAEQHLDKWSISLAKVDTLLLTHSHYDHVGNAAELRRRGATVIAGPGDAEGIELADWRTAPYVDRMLKRRSPVPHDTPTEARTWLDFCLQKQSPEPVQRYSNR